MKREFYGLIVVIALGVLFVQAMAFSLTWHAMVSYAVQHGRTMRGGVGMGIAFHVGFYLLMLACFVASVIAGLVRRPSVRWLWIFMLAAAWLSWNCLFVSDYPIRVPAFAATGVLVLLAGSGFLMRFLGRYLRARPSLQVSPQNG